ncbi:MAG: PQQ-binding-like beta-propeller repeat protein, partial [Gemmatimonadota bacterium]
AAVLTGMLAACGSGPPSGDSSAAGADDALVMFRGDARHTGVYDAPALEAFGGLQWRVQTSGTVMSTPAVANGVVYIGAGDGVFRALDAWTGEARWTFDAGAPIASSAAVGHDLVFFGTRDNAFYALDAATGEARWTFETGADAPFPWGHESGDVYTSSPVLVDDLVLFGSGDGNVYAVDAASGTERWRFATEGRVRSTPAVADGTVYVGSADGSLYAIDLETGERVWRYDTEGRTLRSGEWGYDRRTVQSSPAVVDDIVLVGARDGFLYAVERATGELRWRFDHEISWVNGSPAVADGVAYVGSSDGRFVQAVEVETGEELWRHETASSAWSSAAVVDGLVYIGDGAGNLYALDRATGEERWGYRAGGRILSSPVPADGLLFFGSHDGGIYAVRGAADGRGLRRAVFWDEAYAATATVPEHERIRDHLAEHGYAVVDAAGLADLMRGHVDGGGPSVVVFAMDRLPETVAPSGADTVLFRRYLDAGGKAVWLGVPPLMWPPDPETGARPLDAIDRAATERLLGVDHGTANFDPLGARATADGERWGLDGWWLDRWSVDPSGVTTVLAHDDFGLAAAWHRDYGGPPGTGFVRVRGGGIPGDGGIGDLVGIRTAAEYLPRRPGT